MTKLHLAFAVLFSSLWLMQLRHLEERFPEHPTDARQRLLQSAGDSFQRLGYEGTSVSSVAAAAGVKTAAVYYHFESKEDLLYEFLANTYEGFLLEIADAVGDADDPLAELARMAWAHTWIQLTFRRFSTAHIQTFSGSQLLRSLGPERSERLRRLAKAHPDNCRRVICEGVESGAFAVPNPTSAALAITTVCEFTPLWYRLDGPLGPEDVADHNAYYAVRLVGVDLSPEEVGSLVSDLRTTSPTVGDGEPAHYSRHPTREE